MIADIIEEYDDAMPLKTVIRIASDILMRLDSHPWLKPDSSQDYPERNDQGNV